MPRLVLRAGAVAIAALALGLGSAWWALRSPRFLARVSVGAWDTSLLAGSTTADIHTRARVALLGLLALDRSETLYFVAERDDAGRPLRAACDYAIEGTAPPARWWSITAYGADYYLIANPANRYSFNQRTAAPDGVGRFRLVAAREPQPGHWLPTTGAPDRFVLNLRLYNPEPALAARPETLTPPRITPIGACP